MSKVYDKPASIGHLSKCNTTYELHKIFENLLKCGADLQCIVNILIKNKKIGYINNHILKILYDNGININLSNVKAFYCDYHDINYSINFMKWLKNNYYDYRYMKSCHSHYNIYYEECNISKMLLNCNLDNIIEIIEIIGVNNICRNDDFIHYVINNNISTDILDYLFDINIFNNRNINIFKIYVEHYRFLGSLYRIIYFVRMFRKYRYPYLDYRYICKYNKNTILHDITYCNYKNIKKSNGIIDYLINILPEPYPDRINNVGSKYNSPPSDEDGYFDEDGNEIMFDECDECGGNISNCYCGDY